MTGAAQVYGASQGDVHDYLLTHLGWFYLLNMEGQSDWDYQPKSYVLNKLVDTVYKGKKLTTADGIKGIANFIFRNTAASGSFIGYWPGEYDQSGTTFYTSGIQQLEKLETLLDIMYSELEIDQADTSVRDMFDSYYHTDASALTHEVEPKGPFHKFLKAISWSIAHTTSEVDRLSDIYNPDTCSDEMIVRMADFQVEDSSKKCSK